MKTGIATVSAQAGIEIGNNAATAISHADNSVELRYNIFSTGDGTHPNRLNDSRAVDVSANVALLGTWIAEDNILYETPDPADVFAILRSRGTDGLTDFGDRLTDYRAAVDADPSGIPTLDNWWLASRNTVVSTDQHRGTCDELVAGTPSTCICDRGEACFDGMGLVMSRVNLHAPIPTWALGEKGYEGLLHTLWVGGGHRNVGAN